MVKCLLKCHVFFVDEFKYELFTFEQFFFRLVAHQEDDKVGLEMGKFPRFFCKEMQIKD